MTRPKHINELLNNWDTAESLNCNAILRYYDPNSYWQCFILAVNPQDEDEMYCIIASVEVDSQVWRFSEMNRLFNSDGESPSLDLTFRPIRADVLLKQL